MLKNTTLFILIFIFYLFSPIYAITNPQDTKVDSIIKKYALELMEDSSMIALSLGIYNKGDEFFFNFGTIEKGKNIPPTKNTIYEIGSITKTFTGILLANALLDKKVDLNEDIRIYLNENYDNLKYHDTPIKVINLANHSSGLPEDIIPKEFKSLKNPTMFDIINLFEGDRGSFFLKDLHDVNIDYTPGNNIQYSNTGMILLGIILENIYNTNYSVLINKYFTIPLNMKNTETVSYKSETDNYTKGYDKTGKIMPHITFQIAGAAGGLKSTTYDMLKYIRANINTDNEAIRISHKSTIKKNGQEMGLGWKIRFDVSGKKMLWHDGGEPGFSSYIALIPEKEIGIICLTNQRGRQNQLENLSDSIFKDMLNN
jgi:CubicO group peptidase (beta-lactamase class C family)